MNKKIVQLKRCLVTGGAGFIGSHLTKKLLREGYKITVVDDLSEGKWENLPKHKNLRKFKRSILENMSPFVKSQDVIFHLAALPRLQRSVVQPWETHKVNVDGTLNLLMEAKKHKVKKFIFASSSSVYGNNKTPFKEEMIPSPLVPYSLHKIIGENYCKMFSLLWGLETISLRFFSVYGPNMNPESPYALVLPKFMKMLSEGKSPTIYGDGTHRRDFTYIDDVVEAILLAAKSNLKNEIINIGYGKGVSVNEVFKTLNKLMKKNIKPKYGPAVPEPKNTLANNLKAKKLLGWKPKVSFEEGLKLILKNA